MNKYFIFLMLIFSVACATAPTPIPDPQSIGARLYVEKCGVCHSVPHPKRHTFEQWRHMLTLMDKRMEEKLGAPLLAREKTVILEYLKRNSS